MEGLTSFKVVDELLGHIVPSLWKGAAFVHIGRTITFPIDIYGPFACAIADEGAF